MDKVDITIIGAGVVGLAVARELSVLKNDILVIEAINTQSMEDYKRRFADLTQKPPIKVWPENLLIIPSKTQITILQILKLKHQLQEQKMWNPNQLLSRLRHRLRRK